VLPKTVKIEIYKSIVLPVVLYGCETWSLTLRAEHTLKESENSVLSRIVGLKRDEIISGWRKLHNEDLHNLYPSPDIITTTNQRRMRWEGHVEKECILDFGGEARRKETTEKTKT
jgi:hypothetical protein